MLYPVAESVPLREAALIEPASVAWHAVTRAGGVAGRRVLVIGCGPIGALTVAALRWAGATDVVGADLHPFGLHIAARVGATQTLLAADIDAVDGVDADVVIESSGSSRGLATALRAVTRGGRVILVGMPPPGDQPVAIAGAVVRELELVGAFRFNDEIRDVIAALEDRSLNIEAVVTHEFDVSDAVAAFEVALDASQSSKVLLRF
jgi:L-idonate 5-dehydrogenase